MGSTNSTNKGSQSIGFRYQEEARAGLFNRNLSKILPAGIYALQNPAVSLGAMVGGYYTGIFVNPLTVLINDNNQEADLLGIFPRIETTTSFLVPFQLAADSAGHIDISRPYIALRFGWAEVVANYMDIVSVSSNMDNTSADPTRLWPGDLILGKILYDADGATGKYFLRQTGPLMDFTRATWSFIPSKQIESQELLVQGNDADPTKVYVQGGWLTTGKGKVDVIGQATAAISSTPSSASSAGRIDLVWIDESGVIHVQEGIASPAPSTPAVAPPYNNRKILAEIRRAGSRATVEGPEIYNLKTTRDGMIYQGPGSTLDADTWDGIQSQFAAVPRGIITTGADVYTVLNAATLSGNWEFSIGCLNTPEGAAPSIGEWSVMLELLQSSSGSNNGYAMAFQTGTRELWWNTVVAGTFGAWKKIWVDETAQEVLRTSTFPEWQNDVTYTLHQGIARNGIPYRSKIASNLNVDPATDTASISWEITGGGGGATTTTGTAGETIAQFKWVYLGTNGKFFVASKDSIATGEVYGIALNNAVLDGTLKVQSFGSIAGAASGLTPGQRVYLGDAGASIQDTALVLIGQLRSNVGIALNATDIFVTVTEGTLMYSNDTVQTGLGDLTLWMYSTSLIPPSHKQADGQAVSRTTYSQAFALWGITHGAGDGVTTFNVPDMTGMEVVDPATGLVSGVWIVRMFPLSIVLASQLVIPPNLLSPVGGVMMFSGPSTPTGWFNCDGSSYDRSTWSALFEAITLNKGTVVLGMASSVTLITLSNHGMKTGDCFELTTTGTLQAELSPNTNYYVIYVDANSFKVAASYANALLGLGITSSGGGGLGSHSMRYAPWGISGASNFFVPDMREAAPVGLGSRGSGVAAHDVYSLANFKDDQFQNHIHYAGGYAAGASNMILGAGVASGFNASASTSQVVNDGTSGAPRGGLVTRGKRIGMNFIIKAV